jgi:hypothetical protein
MWWFKEEYFLSPEALKYHLESKVHAPSIDHVEGLKTNTKISKHPNGVHVPK